MIHHKRSFPFAVICERFKITNGLPMYAEQPGEE